MKVLFVALGIFESEGGIQQISRRVLRVLSEMIDSGKIRSAHIISLWDSGENWPVPTAVVFKGTRRSKYRAVISFIQDLIIHRPNLVLLAHVYLSPLAILAKLTNADSQCILMVYGVEVWDKPNLLLRWSVDNFVDKVISISHFTTRKMSNGYGLSTNRFYHLPPAVDVKSTHKMGDRSSGALNILSVCRLSQDSRHKNIDKVIKALPIVMNSFPRVMYSIVGDGDWKPELESLCRELGLLANVRFLGEITEAFRDNLYGNADVFVLPSSGEGFGIVYLEAWKFSLPVIASLEGAATEVIQNGVDGLCVSSTPEELARAIIALLAAPELRKRMGRAGWKKVRQSYSHEVFRTSLEALLIEVI